MKNPEYKARCKAIAEHVQTMAVSLAHSVGMLGDPALLSDIGRLELIEAVLSDIENMVAGHSQTFDGRELYACERRKCVRGDQHSTDDCVYRGES